MKFQVKHPEKVIAWVVSTNPTLYAEYALFNASRFAEWAYLAKGILADGCFVTEDTDEVQETR